MGRIADALKKAKGERDARHRISAAMAKMPGAAPAIETVEPTASAPAAPVIDHEVEVSPAPAEEATPVTQPARRASKTTKRPRLTIFNRRSAELTPSPIWDVHPTVVSVFEKSSPITEQYRAARTWLLRRYSPSKMNCVAVTSSVPREGKSVTTANLAVVMAEVRHMNVLAVDCDFRQGSIAKLFKYSNSPGLSDVLAGRSTLEEAIQRTPLGNLFVLPGGTCHEINSTELLNSTAATKVFDEIRERFHYTLVDTPPVQALSDVGVIGALCSGIVMVVRMNRTPAHVVRQSLHWLQANNLQVLGCIAADCSAKGARYEYDGNDDD